MKAAYNGKFLQQKCGQFPFCLFLKAPWNGCEMFLSCENVVKRLLRMPVNTLPKKLVMEMGL